MTPEHWNTLLLVALIFVARVLDVALGTLRILFIARGQRLLAPLLGFVEVFIWIVAVSQLIKNVHSLAGYLGYAAGFAVGNYVGMWIENRLALGKALIRIILPDNADAMISALQQAGYGLTSFDAQGSTGPVKVIYTAILRRELPQVARLIERTRPHTFFTVEEIRSAREGVFHASRSPWKQQGLKAKL